jgi:hypothetical protein
MEIRGARLVMVFLIAGLIGVFALEAPAQNISAATSIETIAKQDLIRGQAGLKQKADAAEKFYALTRLAPIAYNAGELPLAAAYSESLLKQAEAFKGDWNYGNALHVANLVLGRIALAGNDLDAARSYLLAAGRTPGSPQLDTFGPDMLLAGELLAKGESETVIEYFKLCGAFWKTNDGKLADWTAAVKKGAAPDFGPNIRYVF